MTSQPAPNYNATPNLFGLNAGIQSRGGGSPYYHFDAQPLGDGRYYWEAIIYALNGGLNVQEGDYDRDFDRTSSSTLDTRFARYGTLPLLTTAAATPDPSTPFAGIHHARIYGTLFIGIGDDAPGIVKETSSTNPALTALSTSYDPGDNQPISCLVPLVYGGVTNAQRLVVGRVGAIPQAIEDADGSLDATTADSALSSLWGVIPTFLGDISATDPMTYWYAGTTLLKTHQSEDIDATPQTVLTGLRAGGYAVGLHKVGTGPVRAYLFIPRQNTAAGALTTEVDGDIVSFNIGDPEDIVPVNFKPYLPKVTWGDKYRNGLLATDGERLMFWDGSEFGDTEIFSNPPADSDKEYRIRGCWIIGDTLRALVNRRASPSGTGNTVRMVWEFNFRSWAWNPVSTETTLSSTGSFGTLPGGSLPWSDVTRFLHNYEDGKWYRQEWNQPGVNPYSQRKTAGAQSSTGSAFESSGTVTLPAFTLPGLEDKRLEVRGGHFMGNIEAGEASDNTSPTTIDLKAKTFSGTYTTVASWTPKLSYPGLSEGGHRTSVFCDKVQPQIVVTQGSGGTDPTRYTPNFLPIKIYGYAYDRDKAPPSQELPGWPKS